MPFCRRLIYPYPYLFYGVYRMMDGSIPTHWQWYCTLYWYKDLWEPYFCFNPMLKGLTLIERQGSTGNLRIYIQIFFHSNWNLFWWIILHPMTQWIEPNLHWRGGRLWEENILYFDFWKFHRNEWSVIALASGCVVVGIRPYRLIDLIICNGYLQNQQCFW